MNNYAFFDVDGTLIKMTSMIDFQHFASAQGALPDTMNGRVCRWLLKRGKHLLPRRILNSLYYRQFSGCSHYALETLGEQWFVQRVLHSSSPCWQHNALNQLRWHQQQGHCVVLVSGSFKALLKPLAHHLGVEEILCANPSIKDGLHSGKLLAPQTIGRGKAKAITIFLQARRAQGSPAIWAYGDHSSDIPMLLKAHTPVVVAGDPSLQDYARARGWHIIEEAHP